MRRREPMKAVRIMMIVLAAAFIAGLTAGIIYVTKLGSADTETALRYLNGFLTQDMSSGQGEAFFEALLKYGKLLVLIAALAFIPRALLLAPLLLAARGFATGFSVGFIIKELGGSGIILSFQMFGIQQLITLPAYLFLALSAYRYAHAKRGDDYGTPEFALSLVICSALIALAAFAESFIVPMMVG